jgi:hypothetical protein
MEVDKKEAFSRRWGIGRGIVMTQDGLVAEVCIGSSLNGRIINTSEYWERSRTAIKGNGIKTIEQLAEMGSKRAWRRIKEIDDFACLYRLYALVGAIQGIDGITSQRE